MTAQDLGRAIARVCALAVELDEVDFHHDVVLRGTGRPFYGGIESMMAMNDKAIEEARRHEG